MSLCNVFKPFYIHSSTIKANHIPVATASSTQPQTRAPPTNTAIIELFQSQGCNSCPPANDACIALASRNDPRQLLLTYEVTYWDHLGWPDTFADARWDSRQRDYAAALGQRSVYTPQVIVDGGARPIGNSWRNLPAALAKSGKQEPLGFDLVDEERRLRIAGEGKGTVVLVFFEVEPVPVRILRGENKGEVLPHRNVVREMEVLGTWDGGVGTFNLPARRAGLEMAVLVQAGSGGHILGATRV